MIFTSDNAAGAHPAILEAMGRAAEGPAAAYGNDDVTRRLEARIREVFEAPEARTFLVATGTAANSLALAALCPPWAAIYAHEASHIEEDECGAPGFFTGGAKITLLGGAAGKIDADDFVRHLRETAPRGVHNVQAGPLSVTQATELGGVYTLDELRALTAIARAAGLPVHMDGARFANAVARLGCTPAEASWKAGVDVLSLGATKCGALAAEAIVLFDPASAPDRAWELELRRKRGGHLFSKMRFVSAQMEAWLEGGLWLELGAHANALAARLAAGIRTAEGCRLLHPVEANILFAEIPLGLHRRLQEAGARYYPFRPGQTEDGPDDTPFVIRLVTSYETTEAEVDAFISALRA